MIKILLTGPYDIYGKSKGTGAYSDIGKKTLNAEVGIFNIIIHAAVYISIICIFVSAIMLIIGSKGKSEKLADAKGFFIKTLVVSALIFGVGGLINLVIGMGLD